MFFSTQWRGFADTQTKGSACFAVTNSLVIVGVFDDEACKDHHPSPNAGALACNKVSYDQVEWKLSSPDRRSSAALHVITYPLADYVPPGQAVEDLAEYLRVSGF